MALNPSLFADTSLKMLDELKRADVSTGEDIKTYAWLTNCLRKLLSSGEAPPISASCDSPVCYCNFPRFNKMRNGRVFCSQCSRSCHLVCALVLSQHQAENFDFDSWLCFTCCGISSTEKVLKVITIYGKCEFVINFSGDVSSKKLFIVFKSRYFNTE